jgi:hypothetical protein
MAIQAHPRPPLLWSRALCALLRTLTERRRDLDAPRLRFVPSEADVLADLQYGRP